ncbi:MAG: endolytic transglycosylase MltG, partial [candidate division WOR-3 bacterium]|nr:endolytic transglycosylase MltG [candidate division WOR-3 bacterium]
VLRYDRQIKAGRYRLATNQSTLRILKELCRGQESKLLVTIPEGYNIKDIANLLASEGICSEQAFLDACHNKELLNSLNINNSTVEGYLYPDSYDFMFGSDPKEIIQRMVKRFWQILSELKIAKIENTAYIDSIVIMASIIEKEAKIDSERPIIASVFYNRLRLKMPLQSCATVQYILPNHKEQLSLEDIQINSPYNTYLHIGLPPSAICNPGKASILAAANPAKTQYRYFAVDKNGRHHFSKTFYEHQQFVKNKEKP